MKKAICIFLCLCLSLCFLSGCSQDKEEPEEIIVTVNGKEFVAQQGETTVSTPEIFELCRAFQLDPSEWPLDLGDCREYTVEPTENTEKIAALLSYAIWDQKPTNEANEKLRSVVEGWGLSSENRMTAQWVVDNLDLAWELIDKEYVTEGLWAVIHSHVDDLYEKYVLSNSDVSSDSDK